MIENTLNATEITTVIMLSLLVVFLLGLIIYKVLTLRNQRRHITFVEQGKYWSNVVPDNPQQIQAKSPTSNELDDLETKEQ
jgi:hypothetical protein